MLLDLCQSLIDFDDERTSDSLRLRVKGLSNMLGIQSREIIYFY